MKNLIVTALLLLSACTFAQEKMGNESNPHRKGHLQHEEREAIRLKKLTSELNLDAKQQEQIKVFMSEQKAKREAFMKERMANKEAEKEPTKEELKARREKMQGAKKEMDEKLKSILTPEQFTKWSAIKEEAKDKMKEKRKERKGTE